MPTPSPTGSVPLGEHFPVDVPALEAAVLEPVDDAVGLGVLQDWLLDHLRPQTELGLLAAAAMERIRSQAELRTVEQLCHEMEMPKRTLQRLFREHVGAPPKWVILHHRLQEAATRLARGELDTVGGLAIELGYSDQSHLTRDFRRTVGKPPAAFLRERRRDR